jgi:hypothetical protein
MTAYRRCPVSARVRLRDLGPSLITMIAILFTSAPAALASEGCANAAGETR